MHRALFDERLLLTTAAALAVAALWLWLPGGDDASIGVAARAPLGTAADGSAQRAAEAALGGPREVAPVPYANDAADAADATPRSPTADVDDDIVSSPPPEPRTERQWQRLFAAELTCDASAAAALLATFDDGPDCRRVALLRSLWRAGVRSAADAAARRALATTSARDAGVETVAAFAVAFLGDEARTSARARELLADFAFAIGTPDATASDSALRGRAALAWAASASAAELSRAAVVAARLSDALVREGLAAGLRLNPDRAAAARTDWLLVIDRQPEDLR